MASDTIGNTKCLQILYTRGLTIKKHRFWVHHIEHPPLEKNNLDYEMP